MEIFTFNHHIPQNKKNKVLKILIIKTEKLFVQICYPIKPIIYFIKLMSNPHPSTQYEKKHNSHVVFKPNKMQIILTWVICYIH